MSPDQQAWWVKLPAGRKKGPFSAAKIIQFIDGGKGSEGIGSKLNR
jgi:hypothetical protein